MVWLWTLVCRPSGAICDLMLCSATVITQFLLLMCLAFHSSQLYLDELHELCGMEFWDWSYHGHYSSSILKKVIQTNGHVKEGVQGGLVILASQCGEHLWIESLVISGFESHSFQLLKVTQHVDIQGKLSSGQVSLLEAEKFLTYVLALRRVVKDMLKKS